MGVSGHEFARAAFDSTISGAINIKDPGTGGTLSLGECNGGLCELTIAAAAETRVLPTASSFKSGVEVTVVANQITTAGTHYCTVNSVVLSVEGDFAVFKTMLINDAMTWQCIHRGGTGVYVAPPAPVTLSTSLTLTAALHANRPLLMNGAGGARTYTLPTPASTGNRYTFYVAAVNTSNYLITDVASQINGQLLSNSVAADPDLCSIWIATLATTCTLNGTTTGGAQVGDWIEFIDLSAGYMVRGVTTSTTAATPWS